MSQSGTQRQNSILPRSVPPDRAPVRTQPRWRRDFPIDWSDDDYVSRRDLVKYLVLVSSAFGAGQVWIACKSLLGPNSPPAGAMAIATVGDLPIGGAKTFAYPRGSTPRLLVRTSADGFVAYDQQCTHLQCPVVPAVEQGKLHCPCHNGWFDLETGAPIAGPPRRHLKRVHLKLVEETVYAVGVEAGGETT